MSTKVELAAALAKHFHAGQKYGEYDYFSHHLCGVVEKVYQNYSVNMTFSLVDAVCVAYLHDVIEDTCLDLATVYKLFDMEIGCAVETLTKKEYMSRYYYLDGVNKDNLSTFVKICDAEFNRDSCLAEGDQKRAKYYQETIDYLKGGK